MEPVQKLVRISLVFVYTGPGGSSTDQICCLVPNGSNYEGDPIRNRTVLKSVPWTSAELRHDRIVQSPHENYFNVCRQHKEK